MGKFLFNSERIVGIPLVVFLALFPLFSNSFQTGLMGKFIIFIIFAIALDLVWGYTGLLSIGHAVFFGLGGYILALSYTFQNGVPTFMQRFDINEIPFWLAPLQSMPLAFLLGLLVPALLAAFIGFFIFRSSVTGVYFSLITLVMATLFQMVVINLQAYTGGYNGLMGLPRFPIFGEPLSLQAFYYLILAITIGVYLFAKWLTNSHFGKVIKAIRENETRVGFFSYNASNYKIFVFTLSGFLSGLAGMLYVSMNGFVGPTDVGVALSTSVILWIAIGGRGKLMGAVIGALAINYISNSLSELYPVVWQLFLGLVMILVVILLPDGVYGTFEKKLAALKHKKIKIKAPEVINKGKESMESN